MIEWLAILMIVLVHAPAVAEALQQIAQVLWTGHLQQVRWRLRARGLSQPIADDDLLPPISLIAPAFNEEVGVVVSIEGLLSLDYPDFEVVVIDDGSTDRTFELLHDHFGLVETTLNVDTGIAHQPILSAWRAPSEHRPLVIRKVNGGCKADANNAGIVAAGNPLICMVDCDSLLDRDALRHAAGPFCHHPDDIAGVGGQIRVLNGCRVHAGHLERINLPRHPFALAQVGEYLRAFMAFRALWSHFRGHAFDLGGDFGLYRRDVVMEIGGYNVESLGEDLDLVMRLHANAPRLGAGCGQPISRSQCS